MAPYSVPRRRRGALARAAAVAACLVGVGCAGDRPPAEESAARPDPQEAAVLGVVQEFLDGLAAQDSAALARTLLAEGSAHAVEMRPGREAGRLRSRTGAEDAATVGVPGPAMVERIRDPEVRVRGRVAVVWAPYDFWLDGAWSHCGTDIFTLANTPSGWVLTSMTYTLETEGCSPAPLEP